LSTPEQPFDCFEALLRQGAEAVDRLKRGPEVKGYEKYLVGLGQSPLEARLMGRFVHYCAEQLQAEQKATRTVTIAFGKFVKNGTSTLRISRAASRLSATLEQNGCLSTLTEILDAAGVPEPSCDIRLLIDRAKQKDVASGDQLVQAAKGLVAKLPDPRGKLTSIETLTHAAFDGLRSSLGEALGDTWDDLVGDFVDPATRASRAALNKPKFNPRPSRRQFNPFLEESA
jgi:hypothetical protein